MPHPFSELTIENRIKYIFTPCPGTKGEQLAMSITTLKAAGAEVVVSLLSDAEISALGVTDLGEEIIRQGMVWYQLPIEDDCAPDKKFMKAFTSIKPALLRHINRGDAIAIHCRGGSGRTGLMAAILLLECGFKWADVQAQIQSLRPQALTLPAHLDFIHSHYLA